MKFIWVPKKHTEWWSLGIDLSKAEGYVWLLVIGLGRRALVVEIGNQCGYDYDWLEEDDD